VYTSTELMLFINQ